MKTGLIEDTMLPTVTESLTDGKKASTKGYINCGGLYSGIFRKISFMTCPEKVNVGKNNNFPLA